VPKPLAVRRYWGYTGAMTSRALFRSIRRRKALACVIAIATMAAALAVLSSQPPTYRATASISFYPAKRSVAAGPLFGQSLPVLLATYAQLAADQVFQDAVGVATGQSSAAVKRALSVTPQSGAAVLNISATSTDANTAARVANAAAAELGLRVKSAAGNTSNSTLVTTQTSRAPVPTSATGPRRTVELAAIVLTAIIVGALAALAFDALFRRVSDPEAVAGISDVSVIGVLPRVLPRQPGPALAIGVPGGDDLLARCTMDMRTNLLFGTGRAGPWRTFSVLGADQRAGVTTTVVNLAVGLAEIRTRVVVVDAASSGDARDLLRAGHELPVGVEVETIDGTTRGVMQASALSRHSDDLVIVDGPPVSTSPIARVLAAQTDATILVVPSGRLRPAQLRRQLESLQALDINVAGIVLTGVSRRTARAWATTRPAKSEKPPANSDGVVEPAISDPDGSLVR
jgi:capsular polysaccharide biosynthesis protein